MLAARVIS